MGRVKGTVLSTTYEPGKRQPLDARQLVTKKADLINPTIWTPTGVAQTMCYNGMVTAVNSDEGNNGIYYLVNRNAITEENYNAYTEAAAAGTDTSMYFGMWIKLGELNDIHELANRINELSDGLESAINSAVDAKLDKIDLFGYEDLDNVVIFSGGTSASI